MKAGGPILGEQYVEFFKWISSDFTDPEIAELIIGISSHDMGVLVEALRSYWELNPDDRVSFHHRNTPNQQFSSL